MKLSESTLSVLNNLKNLNDSMIFYPGREIKILSTDRSVYATATIEDELPKKFALFSVREFLQVLTVIKDADIDFQDDHMLVSNKQNTAVVRYATAEITDDVYQKKIALGSPSFEVEIPVDQIKNMFKMAGYLGIHDVTVESGESGRLVMHDRKASHNHTFTVELNTPIEVGNANFNISVLSMLDMGYRLAYFPDKNMVRFSGVEFPVNYHVSTSR